MDNAFIESLNGRLRDECLNVHQFATLAHAQAVIEVWRCDYQPAAATQLTGAPDPK